jgi:hypothetical protein
MLGRLGLPTALVAGWILCCSYQVSSAVFKVVNSDTTGAGSLFWAIQQTQSRIGPDTILFAIPKTDKRFDGQVCRIYLNAPLPALLDGQTFIDGFSQADTNPVGPEIEIHGDARFTSVEGWQIHSAGNRIQGLCLGLFPNTAISLAGSDCHDNIVAGCYIGCATDGKSRLRNRLAGIECIRSSHHNTIGGETARLRNVLSGNGTYGIRIEDGHSNTIIGNYIGVDYTGLEALPNGDQPRQQNCAGIILSTYAKSNVIGNGKPAGRNVLSGNNRTGLRIEWTGADYNIIQGNYLGLGADGRTRIANGEAGLVIGRGARYNIIGGDSTGQANVISGNYSSGVQFARASAFNVFKGNYVGTDAQLHSTVANAHNGLYFYGDDSEGYPQDNIIGPKNIICGNGNDPASRYWAGLSLDYAGTTRNVFYGNYIGCDPGGRLQAGQPTGILVQRGSHDNVFGPDNIIAYSQYDGILVMNSTTTGNRMTKNSIFSNGLQAIRNLDGGNGELKAPVLAYNSEGRISGNTLPLAEVEIYGDMADQAQRYLVTIRADSSGRFSWTGAIAQGWHLNALVIDDKGNTSQLSNGSVVPVELAEFSGHALSSHTVKLQWRTTSESDNYGFRIQRRTETTFTDVAFIPGGGTNQESHVYTYIDSVESSAICYYRLQQIDLDGSIAYSAEISVMLPPTPQTDLASVYPNPFNATATITYHVNHPQQIVLTVYDVQGHLVNTLANGLAASGIHHLTWDGHNDQGIPVASGQYFIILKSAADRLMRSCLLLR